VKFGWVSKSNLQTPFLGLTPRPHLALLQHPLAGTPSALVTLFPQPDDPPLPSPLLPLDASLMCGPSGEIRRHRFILTHRECGRIPSFGPVSSPRRLHLLHLESGHGSQPLNLSSSPGHGSPAMPRRRLAPPRRSLARVLPTWCPAPWGRKVWPNDDWDPCHYLLIWIWGAFVWRLLLPWKQNIRPTKVGGALKSKVGTLI
jgi:hypothetical protein